MGARARVKRFVFLSIVACEAAPDVPHFHAKAVAEDLIKASGLPDVLTDDLAVAIARAATYPSEEIVHQTIDIGWRDGAKSQDEIAELITQITGKPLSRWVVPWVVFSVMVRLIKPFSELGYDLIQMFLFFRTGKFVSDLTKQQQFFGPAPTAREAIAGWATRNGLKS